MFYFFTVPVTLDLMFSQTSVNEFIYPKYANVNLSTWVETLFCPPGFSFRVLLIKISSH